MMPTGSLATTYSSVSLLKAMNAYIPLTSFLSRKPGPCFLKRWRRTSQSESVDHSAASSGFSRFRSRSSSSWL